MRTRVAAAIGGLVAAWLSAVAAPAAASVLPAAPACTVVGTAGPDVLVGTAGAGRALRPRRRRPDWSAAVATTSCVAAQGDDELSGGPGDDLARGEQGKDVVEGGPGDDVLRGGKGNDQLDGRDDGKAEDVVRCGPGTADRAFADVGDDVVSGCEVVNQNDPPTAITLKPSAVDENSPAGTARGHS